VFREGFSPTSLYQWIQHRDTGRSGITITLSMSLLRSLRYRRRDAISTAVVSRKCGSGESLHSVRTTVWKLDCCFFDGSERSKITSIAE
jgi:hypothetical protein